MPFRCLFHVHTRHSFDSFLSPEKILAEARAMKVDVLIVTDHNTMSGSLEVCEASTGNPRFVVPAAEYKTEKGDIVGLFLKQEIETRNSCELISEVRAQDGLVALPHPYKAHKLDEELLSQVDLIEIYNSRCSDKENGAARELAEKLNKPVLGGADAHCAGELRAVLNDFLIELPSDILGLKDSLLHAPRQIQMQPVSGIFRPYSQVIKAIKTRDPILFLSQAKHLGLTFVREAFH